MKQTKLQTKLLLLLALPLVAALLFGSRGAWEKWQVVRECAALQTSSGVLSQFGATVHELQKERGRSAVFLESKGTMFAAELPAQRQITDRQVAKLNDSLKQFDPATYGPDCERDFKAALEALGQLSAKRAAISSFTLPRAESAAYYTHTIGLVLDVAAAVSRSVIDHDVSLGMAAYVNFLNAKEQTGIERATLAGVFSTDEFTGDAFARFNKAVASQDVLLRVFNSFATADQKAFVAEKLRGAAVESVAKMRQTAIDKAGEGKFGVSSSSWFDAITTKIDLMKDVEDRLAADYINQAQRIQIRALRTFLTFGLLTAGILVAAVVFGGWLVRSITQPLNRLIADLTSGADQVTAASSEISSSSQSLAEGASEQAASLEETSSSLEEMSSMTQRNAENAGKVKALGSQARAAGDTAVHDMQAMGTAMDAIKTSSDDIAKIIKSIDEIAFQTNILALNAAVEAARAGEAGAGFAVVADEVRSLAQRCAQAAKETAAKIEGAIGKSAQGVAISGKVAAALNDIVAKVRQVDELVAGVAAASREQTQGIAQINSAVSQMDKVTQSNAANAEESASAAEELNAQAEAMKEAVAELLRLVDGSRGCQGPTTKPSPARVVHHATTTSTARARAAARGHGGDAPARATKPAPALATAGGRKNGGIPMDGDFKDF